MNNRRAIVYAALAAVAIGMVFVATLRRFAPEPAQDAPPMPAAAASAGEAAAAAPPRPAATDEPPPPWGHEATGSAATAAPGATGEAASLRERQLHDLQRSMQGVMAEATRRSAATEQHLYAALDTLEQMDDPTLKSQVNLAAVRQNLDVSLRMQAVAGEMQRIAAMPAGPERQQQLDARLAELHRLQAQLRSDVRAAGAPAAPVAPATVP